MLSVIVFLPLLAGVAMLIALVVHQYTVKRPLMPVRQIATTFPVAGIVIAMSAGAASIAVVELAQTALQTKDTPIHAAMLFWPEFGGAVLMAAVFGALFRSRFVPVLALAGTVLLSGGIAVLTGVSSGAGAIVAVGSGLVGLGVGASVSPALFIAGFSLQSTQIQRVFALIELLAGVAAFLVAPVVLHLATTVAKQPSAGLPTGLWVCFGLAAGGGLLALYIMVLGRARLQAPDLDRWQGEGEAAWESPPLAAGIRGESAAPPVLVRS